MHRPGALHFLTLFAAILVSHAEATVTLQISADRLNGSGGNAAPKATLALIVADTDGDGFGPAFTGSSLNAFLDGAGGDDHVVFQADLTAFDTDGAFQAIAAGLDFASVPAGKWSAGDPLFLVWFPTLTFGDRNSTLAGGVSYGVIPLGNTPADGNTENYTYITPTSSTLFGTGPVPAGAVNTSANQTSTNPPAPEIAVTGNGNNVADGSTTPATSNFTDFGSTAIAGGTVSRMFTITNSGSAALTLGTGSPIITLGGAQPGDFAVQTAPTSPVASGGATTTFTIIFDPTAAGLRSATVSFGTNDADENPFNFAIQGTGTNSAPTDISLTGTTVAENSAPATVGNLGATDADATDSHTFTLVAGAGDTDNGRFAISGNSLSIVAAANFEVTPSLTIRVRATDNGSPNLFFEKQFAISVTNVNEAPTDLSLAGGTVAENAGTNASAGTLSAIDPDSASFTFTLVPGQGGGDNGAFTITGSALTLNASANFEAKSSYNIRVEATDNGAPGLNFQKQFTVTVTDVSEAPTDITITGGTIAENGSANATAGTLAAIDEDAPGSGHTFTLVGGTGSTDNGSFNVLGNALRLTSPGDFETKNSYSVRVRATDSANNSLIFEKEFTIGVTDVNEAPTDIALNPASLAENSGADATVGTLSATDPDAGAIHTYSLVSGTGDNDNGSFTILNNALRLTASANFEVKSSYTVRVQATDNGTPSGLTFAKAIPVTITNVNEAPTNLALSSASLTEGSAIGTTIGLLSVIDPDQGDLPSFDLVSGTGDADNADFTIVGAALKIGVLSDFETQSSYHIRIRATDSGSPTGSVENTFVVTILDIDESPGDILITASSLDENNTPGAAVGEFSVVDPLNTDPVRYSLIAGEGDTDNSSFSININDGILRFVGVANFETKNSYSIRVRASDSTAPTPRIVQEIFTITITDVNETPSALQLTSTPLVENSPEDSTVGLLTVSDPDAGDTPSFALVAGTGDADNAAFNIQGSALRLTASPDFEAKESYQVRIQATDSGTPGLTTEQSFTVTITDENEPPVFTKGPDPSFPATSTSQITLANWATGIDDGDADATQALSFAIEVLSGEVLFTTAPALTPSGTLTFTPSGAPGEATLSVILTDDASINGTDAISTAPETFTITATAAEIAVNGNTVDIVNGDNTPDAVDDTHFESAPVSGGTVARSFTIENVGDSTLTLGQVTIGGSHPGDFSVTQAPQSPVAPGESTVLQVTFDPVTSGLREASLSFTNNDSDESPFVFAIQGTGSAPEIVVEEETTEIASGATLSFADVRPGGTVSKTLTIRNTGDVALTGLAITFSGSHPTEFSDSLAVEEIEPGDFLEVSVTFTPTVTGPRSATLSLANNDLNENPFVINLAGLADTRNGKPVALPIEPPLVPDTLDSVWDPNAPGTYDGLLYEGTALVGAVSNFKVTAPAASSSTGGGVTASVRLNQASATLRGTFDADGHLVSAPGAALGFDLQLQKSTGSDGFGIRGTVALNGVTAQAWLPRVPFSRTNLVPAFLAAAGPYTISIPSAAGWGTLQPGGDGWATASLATTGVLSVSGVLGDGTKFTETGYLSADGEISLYAELYAKNPGKGLIGGRLQFRDLASSDVDGVLQWRKGADTRNPQRELLYPNGFSEQVVVVGNFFEAPAANTFILSALEDQHYNAELSLIGPTAPVTLGTSLDRIVSWLTNHRIIHYGPQGLSGQVSSRNGSLTGSFSDPVTRARISFSGVVLQKQNIAAGVFVSGVSSGAVRILPGTDFVYPGSETAPTLARLQAPGSAAPAPALTPLLTIPAEAAGTYGGILSSPSGEEAGALEAATLTATGGVSATLWIQGVRQSVRGNLGEDITLANGAIVNLTLASMDDAPGGYVLQGSVSFEAVEYTLEAQRLPLFTRTAPSPWIGAYTLAMSAPDAVDVSLMPGGDGYGTLAVTATGSCTGTITLPDGTRATLGGHIGSAYDVAGTDVAAWSFHRGLYGRTPRGFLAGKLNFRDLAGTSDVDGLWHWVKQTGAAPTTVYPDGFDDQRQVIGSRYTPPAVNTRAMTGLAATTDNVWLRFDGADLSSLLDLTLNTKNLTGTWQQNNAILHYGPQTVRLTFAPRTGALTGTYLDTANGINFAFGGVLIQDQNLLTGSYLTRGQSGLFVIQPR